MGLAAFLIDIDAGEPEGVGACARPIDFPEIFSLAGSARLESEIAVLEQPGVEVHTAFEAGEAMIAENEKDRFLIDVCESLADEGIGAHVKFFDHTAVGAAAVFLREEHVLHAVGGIEDAGHDPAACAIERAEELGLALFVNEIGLFEKGGVIDGVLVERPGVFGHAKRGIRTKQFGEVGGVVAGVRDGQRRIFGVDIDGRVIQRKLRLDFREQEAHDAGDSNAEGGFEGQGDPRCVLAESRVHSVRRQCGEWRKRGRVSAG